MVECELHAVTVVDINVDVEYPWMMSRTVVESPATQSEWFLLPKQLQDRKNNVVDVAKPACFPSFRMVEATRPIDRGVASASAKLSCTSERRTGIHTTEIVHVRKYRTIFDAVERIDQMSHVVLISRSHPGWIAVRAK
jgi:hypothetical protein